MEEFLECMVCRDRFDTQRRRPKLLACGHTVCLQCCVQLRKDQNIPCPMDRQKTESLPAQLHDNYFIIGILENGFARKRFWCLECKTEADSVCEDKHDICRLSKARTKQVEAELAALERLAAQRRKLLDRLLDLSSAVTDSVTYSVKRCTQDHQQDRTALQSLYDGLEAAGPEWEQAHQEGAEATKRSADTLSALDEELELLDAAGTCSLSLRTAAGGVWMAELPLGDDSAGETGAVLRHLLLLLRRAELLKVRASSPWKLSTLVDSPAKNDFSSRESDVDDILRLEKSSPKNQIPVPSRSSTFHITPDKNEVLALREPVQVVKGGNSGNSHYSSLPSAPHSHLIDSCAPSTATNTNYQNTNNADGIPTSQVDAIRIGDSSGRPFPCYTKPLPWQQYSQSAAGQQKTVGNMGQNIHQYRDRSSSYQNHMNWYLQHGGQWYRTTSQIPYGKKPT